MLRALDRGSGFMPGVTPGTHHLLLDGGGEFRLELGDLGCDPRFLFLNRVNVTRCHVGAEATAQILSPSWNNTLRTTIWLDLPTEPTKI